MPQIAAIAMTAIRMIVDFFMFSVVFIVIIYLSFDMCHSEESSEESVCIYVSVFRYFALLGMTRGDVLKTASCASASEASTSEASTSETSSAEASTSASEASSTHEDGRATSATGTAEIRVG